MKLRPENIAQHLKRTLKPIYFITGDEHLLVQETCHAIRVAAKHNGYLERERIQANAQFDWNELLYASQNLSLFSEKRLIELHMEGNKFGKKAGPALIQYTQNSASNTLLLIVSGKLERAQQQTKWFKTIEQAGVVVQVWPLNAAQLLLFIEQRLQQHQLSANNDVLQRIAEYTQGNLLAAHQTIQKLSLLYSNHTLTLEDVTHCLTDHARFDVFNYCDAVMEGNISKIIRMLNRLQEEGTEPLLILWGLCRELRCLYALSQAQTQKQPLEPLFAQHRIWPQRRPLIMNALHRINQKTILALLQDALILDQIIKGVHPGNVWDALCTLSIRITNNENWYSRRRI